LETLKEYATLLHEMHREVEAITLEARIASAVGSSQAAPER
jgi:hypothetical protein